MEIPHGGNNVRERDILVLNGEEVAGVLASGRVVLANLHGEHTITEFEPLPG